MNNELDTNKKKVTIAFLKEKFVMELATCHDNKPAVAPVIYVIDDELNFYFVTYRDTLKSQNLLNNPHCSFVVWEFLQMSVQVIGIAEVVTDTVTEQWVVNTIADAATKDPNFWAPIFRISRGEYILFKITPTSMKTLDLNRNTVRQEETPFTQIVI